MGLLKNYLHAVKYSERDLRDRFQVKDELRRLKAHIHWLDRDIL
jgi:hypothetical protein